MNRMKISALGILSLLLVSSSAFAGDILAGGKHWVDNFGKSWTLTGGTCLGDNAFCISGARDYENTLGCGALPIRGSEVISNRNVNVISLTVFAPNPKCAVSTWFATYNRATNSFEGFVMNNDGVRTPFTMTTQSPSVESRATNSPNDPSLHRARR